MYKIYKDINIHKKVLKLGLRSGDTIHLKVGMTLVNSWLNELLGSIEIKSNKDITISIIKENSKYALNLKNAGELECYYDNNRKKENWDIHRIESPQIIHELHFYFNYHFLQLFNLTISNKFIDKGIDLGTETIFQFCEPDVNSSFYKDLKKDGQPFFPISKVSEYRIQNIAPNGISGFYDRGAVAVKDNNFKTSVNQNYKNFHLIDSATGKSYNSEEHMPSYDTFGSTSEKIIGETGLYVSPYLISKLETTDYGNKQTIPVSDTYNVIFSSLSNSSSIGKITGNDGVCFMTPNYICLQRTNYAPLINYKKYVKGGFHIEHSRAGNIYVIEVTNNFPHNIYLSYHWTTWLGKDKIHYVEIASGETYRWSGGSTADHPNDSYPALVISSKVQNYKTVLENNITSDRNVWDMAGHYAGSSIPPYIYNLSSGNGNTTFTIKNLGNENMDYFVDERPGHFTSLKPGLSNTLTLSNEGLNFFTICFEYSSTIVKKIYIPTIIKG